MPNADAHYSGSIAEVYDRHFGPALFGPYAEDIARRLSDMAAGALLEVAAGTGIVTAALCRATPPAVAITATDLNQPMLDLAAVKPGMARVAWRQADAMALPFPDAAFDAVVCQFGVMFFPDRVRAHAEARRVLRPGGRYVFNVWDGLEQNPMAEVAERTVRALYPRQPPGFLGRVPYGYHDPDVIRADLRAAGFDACTIAPVAAVWEPDSPRDPAIGFCQGSPLRAELEAADPDGPAKATEAVAEAIAARFGREAPRVPMRALVVEARR